MDIRNDILHSLKKVDQSRRITIPRDIVFQQCSDDVYIELCSKALGIEPQDNYNMQDAPAAFEAWALLIYINHLNRDGNIVLDTDIELPNPCVGKNFHYNRFLYRAMKFQEQYIWFKVSDRIQNKIDQFEMLLNEPDTLCFNNTPVGEAGTKENSPESMAEAMFAESPLEILLLKAANNKSNGKVGSSHIYRQLPVGLFQERGVKDLTNIEPHEKIQIFTGSKSAIDLWTANPDQKTISIFELKIFNIKVGIITELMFYANYIYDLFVDTNNIFKVKPYSPKNSRGYEILGKNIAYESVLAFFLTDELHPLISKEVIDEMNKRRANSAPIEYFNLLYGIR